MPSFYPPEITNAARSLDAAAFAASIVEPLVLVVTLPDDGGAEVLETLATTLRGTPTQSVRPVAAMDFNTQIISPTALRELSSATQRVDDRESGSRELGLQRDRYIVRLRKREDVDAAFSERVSVGRATNKDIVLRHRSISKFHAWFQIDDNGIVFVSDAGSKNGTKIGGKSLEAREPAELHPGEVVTFGSIEVQAVTPEQLWRMSRRR